MSLTYWPELLLFMAAVLLVSLYGLTVSGHFPVEYRAERLRSGSGAVLMWGTMMAAGLSGLLAILFASLLLPWYAAVIGGGAMVLFAPMLLQPFPDTFVNGRRGLVAFSAGASLTAFIMWQLAA